MKPSDPVVHIDNNGTKTVVDKTVYLSGMAFNCSAPGTNWLMSIQNRATTPNVLVGPNKLSTLDPPYRIVEFPSPFRMEGGIDVVTSAGTPGVVDIWFKYLEGS